MNGIGDSKAAVLLTLPRPRSGMNRAEVAADDLLKLVSLLVVLIAFRLTDRI